MDESHLLAAVRYLALNPVRAGLVTDARDWAWSSVPAHLSRQDDALVRVGPVLDRVGAQFADLLDVHGGEPPVTAAFEPGGAIGRPMGSSEFVAEVERRLGRRVGPAKRGRKPKQGKTEPTNDITSP
jgi:putative transposase